MNDFTTFNVYLTPHPEKCQEITDEILDIIQRTWNWGNQLKANGYKIAYLMGPIALFEGIELKVEELNITDLESFIKKFPNKDEYLFFLYQKSPKKVLMAKLNRSEVDKRRQELNIKSPKRKKSVKESNLSIDNPTKTG